MNTIAAFFVGSGIVSAVVIASDLPRPEAVHEDNEQRVDTDRALGRIFRIVGLFPVRARETLRAGGRSDADGGAGCRFDADGK